MGASKVVRVSFDEEEVKAAMIEVARRQIETQEGRPYSQHPRLCVLEVLQGATHRIHGVVEWQATEALDTFAGGKKDA